MAIYHIPAEKNFLETLYQGIIERFSDSALEKLHIFLPNKQSCYALTKIFFDKLSLNEARLLPKIIPLGEISDLSTLEDFESISANNYSLPHPISLEEQKLLIFKLIREKAACNSMPLKNILLLSDSLVKAILKLRTDNVPLNKIFEIIKPDASVHLNLYHELLRCLAQEWPDYLKKNHIIDIAEYHNLFIDNLIADQKIEASKIIIAGSTGSISATRKLMHYVHNQKGCVVLHNFDCNKKQYWNSIDENHPNYCLKELLSFMDVNPTSITNWSKGNNQKSYTNDVLDIFAPAEEALKWGRAVYFDKKIELIEVQDINQEAFSIAVRVKEILDTNTHAKIGIITPSDKKILRLEQYLSLLEIDYKNDRGIFIRDTDEFQYISLLKKFISERFLPKNLLAILKNKFTNLRISRSQLNAQIEILEKQYLRKICNYQNLNSLISSIKEEPLKNLLQEFKQAISALHIKTNSLSEFTKFLIQTLNSLGRSAKQPNFWDASIGQKLFEILSSMVCVYDKKFTYKDDNIFDIFLDTLASQKIFINENSEAKTILTSPIESRLMNFTHVILTDFNENCWPPKSAVDPWFNRETDAALGLKHEILRSSLAAHDFASLINQQNIIITRSLRDEDGQTSPSQWLERIKLYQAAVKRNFLEVNTDVIQKCKNVFKSNITNKYFPKEPSPPIAIRPRELSVTQIEKLMRDPYSIYAQKVLGLKKLQEVDKEIDQADFGNFIHDSIDEFNKTIQIGADFLDQLIAVGQSKLRKYASNRPIVQKIWWPRYLQIAKWYSNFETLRRQKNCKILSESEGHIIFNTSTGPFKLKAKADQLEINQNKVTVIDFKTGVLPSHIDIVSGFSPQVTLEGLIAQNGGFSEEHKVEKLIYIQFSTGKDFGKILEIKEPIKRISEAKTNIQELINLYINGNTPFLICPYLEKAPIYSDYKYLERIEEWLI